MLTLYGSKGSGSAIVEAALAIIATDYRRVDGAEWERSAGFEELKTVNRWRRSRRWCSKTAR